MAKHIIHLINDVAAVINNDPQIGDKLEGGLYPLTTALAWRS